MGRCTFPGVSNGEKIKMTLKILDKKDKKKILAELEKQYGITEIPFLLIQAGREKIRGYTGSLSKEEIIKLERNVNIETAGIYILNKEQDGLRLSFDAPNLLNVSKNIIEISDEQAEAWLFGRDIETEKDIKGFVIIKNKEDFLGCGKASQGRIVNFVPKERRRKN